MAAFALEGPKWPTTVLTYAFADTSVADGGSFTGALPTADQYVVETAMARWESVSNITFEQVPDGTPKTDIVIGWGDLTLPQVGETDYAYTLGANQTFEPGMTIRLEDPAQLNLSDSSNPVYQGTETNLYQLALHEVGHALGLGLSSDPNAVMHLELGYSNPDLDATDIAGVQALYGAAGLAMTDTTTGVSSAPQASTYTGPADYLKQQYIYTGPDSVNVTSNSPNVFLKAGAGNDALRVTSGNNVLDGGEGSNFLTGGTGQDTFFLDARGGQITWDTIVNFHAGDSVTIWGFVPSVSTDHWDGTSGAAGSTGPTLRVAVDGTNVTSSITFAGMSAAEQSKLVFGTGVQAAGPYLCIAEFS